MDERVKIYISKFPKDVQAKLKKLRKTIKESMPDSEENLSYGVPAFKQKGVLICYAAFKKHIGLYPGPQAIKKFKKQLSDYETSEGTIKFPLEKQIPYKLAKKIVEYCAKEKNNKRK
ncbi:MAG TPA: DUF1801 domain-containing protein [Candidatus Altiarchaeales archaeon]|nr:DUF1801 domain-containing protein [Candidatus Altiarchaeales archaeon]